MKKAVRIIVVIALCAALVAAFSACEKAEIKDPPFSQGQPEVYTLEFYVDGALYGIALCKNGKLAMPENPQKDGYLFDGWFYDSGLTNPFNLEKYLLGEKGDFCLYARFVKEDIPENPDNPDNPEEPEEPDNPEEPENPVDPEEKTFTVAFLLDGQVISEQQVKEGEGAVMPLSEWFREDGDELYALHYDKDYSCVKEDITVTLSWDKATEEEIGGYCLGFFTLNMIPGRRVAYLESVKEGCWKDIVIPAEFWGIPIVGIKSGAFDAVPQTRSVTFGKNCKEISWDAFAALDSLSEIRVDDENAYYSAQGLDVYSKDGKSLVRSFSQGEYILKDGVKGIEDEAFAFSNVTSVTLCEGLQNIGKNAFAGNVNITQIELPSSLVSLGEGAFADCPNLSAVVYNCVGLQENTSRETAFTGTGSAVGGFTVSFTDKVRNIPNYAFDNLQNLTAVDFAEGVNVIGSRAFAGTSLDSVALPASLTAMGAGAFADCVLLSSVVYCANITQVSMIDGYFANSGNESGAEITIQGTKSVPDHLFYTMTGQPFRVRSLTLCEGLESVGSLSFAGLEGLENITLPSSLTAIGDGAFYACANLSCISVAQGSGSFSTEDGVLYNADKTKLICYPSAKSVQSYSVRQGVVEVGAYAFAANADIKEVALPDSVTSVGMLAFYGCEALAQISLGNSLQEIATSAFYGCSSLASVIMPESVVIIGENAFANCSSLSEIYIGNGVNSIGSRAFEGCAFKEVFIPTSVTTMGYGVFDKMQGLTVRCEAEREGAGWDAGWNTCGAVVEYSCERSV